MSGRGLCVPAVISPASLSVAPLSPLFFHFSRHARLKRLMREMRMRRATHLLHGCMCMCMSCARTLAARRPRAACRDTRHTTHRPRARDARATTTDQRPPTVVAHTHTGHSPGALRQRRSYGSLEQTRVRDVAIAAHHTAHSPDVALVARSVASSVSVRLDRSNHHEDPLGQSLSVGDPRLPTLEAVSARGRIAHPSTTWGLRTEVSGISIALSLGRERWSVLPVLRVWESIELAGSGYLLVTVATCGGVAASPHAHGRRVAI